MKITFLGGAETVTGSKFLLETEKSSVLIDCGLFQGYKWLRERNWQSLPLDIASLDAVILTHAHLDHSGYVPVLYEKGFRGPIYTHQATTALCEILLADSGHIQEEDAKYYSRHKVGKHAHPKPLYDSLAAEKSMRLFRSVEFEEHIQVKDIQFQLHPAGHILGAASIIVEADGKRVGFSGDVGRSDDILMRPPEPLPPLDLLLLESTYGNRLHERHDPAEQLASIVNRVTSRGGVLLVPAFAVGRTQALQHLLATLIDQGSIPRIPIYLDSPMAIKVSDIFCDRSEQHRLTEAQCHRMEELVTYTRTVDESKALSGQAFPHIIIAGSGMATGGRILHHFKRLLGKPGTEVLFTGYQSGGTRGAKMLDGADTVKIHGQWIPVKAHVEMIDSLSGHADYLELGSWLARSELKPTTKIQLVHGSPDALEGMRVHIQETNAFPVSVAEHHSILRL